MFLYTITQPVQVTHFMLIRFVLQYQQQEVLVDYQQMLEKYLLKMELLLLATMLQ